MPAPATVRAAGYFSASRAGKDAGEAVVRIQTATAGTFSLGGKQWALVGDPGAKTLRGTNGASVVQLRIVNRIALSGTIDGDSLVLARNVLRPIPAAEMKQSDRGPTGAMKTFMATTPDYQTAVGDTSTFWYAFGPVLDRGRLDGSARVIGIASDPGPSECLPFMRRTLVGDSGQKTQGLFAKLGLTHSYVLVNAFAVALRPSQVTNGLKVLKNNAAIMAARHGLYDRLLTSNVQAIISFGDNAHQAYDLWAASNPAVKAVPVFKVAHPAAVDRTGSGHDAALMGWAQAVPQLRAIVTPDADGDATVPNFGDYFTELDYARIPRWDLPKVAPAYAGDDSWGRAATPQHNNCCDRPSPDDRVSLMLTPAPGQGQFLRYAYAAGKLMGAKGKNGKKVAVDQFGIPD